MKSNVFGFALLSAAAIVANAPAQAQNGSLTRSFVSSSGSDTNPCTIAQPCQSFAVAYTKISANGIIAALDKKLSNEILNLGCGCPVNNLEFVNILESLLGKKAIIVDTPTPPSEPLITYADVSKAKRVIGYEPKVSVSEGLERFVQWMRAEEIIG